VLTKLNNKKIGGKHVAVRYAKHIEMEDDGKTKKPKIAALAAGSSSSQVTDKKSKIQLLEEQLKQLQNSSNDFELNRGSVQNVTEPLIKKYQFNKDQPQTSSNRYQYKKKRRPY
jgi:hypothetical protein